MLVVTNVRTLLKAFGVAESIRTPAIVALIALSLVLVVRIYLREKQLAATRVLEVEETRVLSATVAPASTP